MQVICGAQVHACNQMIMATCIDSSDGVSCLQYFASTGSNSRPLAQQGADSMLFTNHVNQI